MVLTPEDIEIALSEETQGGEVPCLLHRWEYPPSVLFDVIALHPRQLARLQILPTSDENFVLGSEMSESRLLLHHFPPYLYEIVPHVFHVSEGHRQSL